MVLLVCCEHTIGLILLVMLLNSILPLLLMFVFADGYKSVRMQPYYLLKFASIQMSEVIWTLRSFHGYYFDILNSTLDAYSCSYRHNGIESWNLENWKKMVFTHLASSQSIQRNYLTMH